ncbi:hypothetical protein CR513_37339, partial [Mucuna pruriens]
MYELVSLNIRSGRLRAFAFAGLESLCCYNPSLDELIYQSMFHEITPLTGAEAEEFCSLDWRT